MLSGDRYHRKGTASVPAHGGTCDSGFDHSWVLKKGTTLARERRQEQSAVYPDRLQLKNSATKGKVCPLGGIWIMSLRRMQKGSPEEIRTGRESDIESYHMMFVAKAYTGFYVTVSFFFRELLKKEKWSDIIKPIYK